jgi:hypothetical protein
MTAPAYLASAGEGTPVPTAQRALGFRLVQHGICLKRIVDPEHRHVAGGPQAPGCPFPAHLGHPRLWQTAAGELFATAEPYTLELVDLDWLLTAARELGLRVMLDGRSVYNPGYTFTILITRPGSAVNLADLALPTRLT